MSRSWVAVMAAIMLHPAGWAQVRETPSLSVDGFGTLGVLRSSEDRADVVTDTFGPEGAGHTRRWSPEVDSKLGLQLTGTLTPRLSTVLQVVVEQRYDDTYRPKIEWANVAYDITPDLTVRAGRMVLPGFLTSEYRKVGYAYPWVRPPQEVYHLVPITNIDGVDISYRFRWGSLTNTVTSLYGEAGPNLPGGGEVEVKNSFNVSNTLEWGFTTLFFSYNKSHLHVGALDPLFHAFSELGPTGAAIADRYGVHDKRSDLLTVGSRYDTGDWFLMGEWTRTRTDTFYGDRHGWYLSGGYRFGTFTPYLTWAHVRTDNDSSNPGVDIAHPQVQALNAALNNLLGTVPQQQSVAIGARWDFARNYALKIQYDRIDLDSGSAGVLNYEQPGFRRGGTVSLFSAALDFVF